MTRLARARRWGLTATAILSLAACDQQRRPGPAEIALLKQQLDAEMNAPIQSLHEEVIRSIADKWIFPEELVVTGEGDPTPVDWWLYGKGFIRLAGVVQYRGYFALTPKGAAFAKAPTPQWLAARFETPLQLNCAGEGSWANCQVSGVAAVTPTKASASLLGGLRFPPQAFQANLVYGPAGWRVENLQATQGPELSEAMRTAIFGDPESIGKARYQWALDMNRRVQ